MTPHNAPYEAGGFIGSSGFEKVGIDGLRLAHRDVPVGAVDRSGKARHFLAAQPTDGTASIERRSLGAAADARKGQPKHGRDLGQNVAQRLVRRNKLSAGQVVQNGLNIKPAQASKRLCGHG